ncbi:MAG: hypothetical protein KF774_09055 [Planctomyces sp.]|nr:hypothetical protein [Planctomyces sp.]
MSQVPEWVDQLVHEVATRLWAHEEAPFGCHVHRAEDCWEISLFLMRVEVFGGGRDGQQVTPPFYLDLAALPDVLDAVDSLTWQSVRLGDDDDLGAHVSLVGRYGGCRVWLRILADAPASTPTAGQLCATSLRLMERR